MTDEHVPQFSTAEFEPTLADSHPLFLRGLLFGAGGALLGFILYSTVGIVTGYEIGLVSLAVGYLVGRSIVAGSRGRTGRRYQIAAAVLTYAAVSMSAVPIAISLWAKSERSAKTEVSDSASRTAGPAAIPVDERRQPAAEARSMSLASAAGGLLAIGLASPFLQLGAGMSGLIGLFILFIGVRIAWRMTGTRAEIVQAVVDGPGDRPTTLNLNR
jgi:hypothetical protein